ncbi:MAG: hypothetical protein AAF726_02795 [Planctomycetota bacterium]
MIDLEFVLLDGSVMSILIGALVAATFWSTPRTYLRDMPPDIQEAAAPITEREARSAGIVGLIVVSILLAGLVISALRRTGGEGYLDAALHCYLVFQVFNLFDLVVLDWGMMMFIDPARPPIPGTENARGYRAFGFHARKSLNGAILGIPFAAAAAGLAVAIG